MTTVIDTPDGILFAQLLAFRARLSIEVNTKLTSRFPTLKAFNQRYGLNCRRKVDALATAENIISMVKDGSHVLWHSGDGTVGLYETAALQADIDRALADAPPVADSLT